MARNRSNRTNRKHAQDKLKPQRPAAPAAPTSWDPIARWYKKWAGTDGSEHHTRLAIPAAIELLRPTLGESILDIGCGTGVLARHIVSCGAAYTGVDASPKLLEFARKHAAPSCRFHLGDARTLASINGLEQASFDGVVFMLSIQDMDPLSEVLDSAAWALKPEGRIVIVMTHPCFRVPRQSGWGWDEERKLTYRRVDRYITPLAVPVRPTPGDKGSGAITSFHRPLQEYINGLARFGFLIDRLIEVPPEADIVERRRSGRSRVDRRRVNTEIPVFLCIRAARGRAL